MYNKYTYDFSKSTEMNINPNLADCFEETAVNSVDINKILNDINSKFIEQMEVEDEKKVEVPPTRFTTRFTKSSKKYK
jgi:hypothetical protein